MTEGNPTIAVADLKEVCITPDRVDFAISPEKRARR